MREILFRGKCVDAYAAGEWAYGFYTNEEYNEVYETPCSEVKDHYIENQDDTMRVDPETIGQYTGLKDKNGKRIFEGDILQTGTIKGNVVWSEKRSEYCLLWKDYGKRCDVLKSPNLASFMIGRDIEVIGTIHDNPELLEVEHER